MKFIGEIGINHNGSLREAIDLIYMAKENNVDIVKFQKRNPDICIPYKMRNQDKVFKGTKMTYLEYKKKIEFGEEEFDVISALCKHLNIQWTSSVWDSDSVKFMTKYSKEIPFLKIPSPCITDMELIDEINKTDIPVIISDGMSTPEEVLNAIDSIKNIKGIFHCNSTYPCENMNEMDMRAITAYKKAYPDLEIGYSGHEKPYNLTITTVAMTLGVDYIERHIRLDGRQNSDYEISLNEKSLEALMKHIKEVSDILGNDYITCYPSEELAKEKLRRIY